jgi:hypothetical protein
MRYQVVHAFMDRSVEIEHEISKTLDALLKDFDFATLVRQEADRAMRDAIKAPAPFWKPVYLLSTT